MLKQIKAVIVGYGNRGQVYADYSLDRPEELSVVAVVDPNEFKLEEAKKRYSLSSDRLFGSFEEFLKSKIECDIVINATMDEMHYETAMQILENGYDMLIEKPIVPNKKELFDIKKAAEKKNLKVFVCHVLRYTPFYKTIKKLIADGEIGEIISMEMNEHVCRQHYLASYDRGTAKKNAARDFFWLNAVTISILCAGSTTPPRPKKFRAWAAVPNSSRKECRKTLRNFVTNVSIRTFVGIPRYASISTST